MAIPTSSNAINVSVRAMEEADLNEARRIFRVAFGTFLGVPEPETFRADREYVFTSWRTEGGAALVAEANGNLAGSNFATQWGSFGFFGPLTIRPEFWDQRIAQRLLGPTMDLFGEWGVQDTGLFVVDPTYCGLPTLNARGPSGFLEFSAVASRSSRCNRATDVELAA